MKRAFLALLLAAVNVNATQDLTGKWRVARLVDFGKVSGSPKKAKKLVGSHITITARTFTFDDAANHALQLDRATKNFDFSCKNATFVVTVVDREETLLNDYRLEDTRTFGLPKRVRQVDLGDCGSMLLRDDAHAIFDWHGAIYELVKQQ